jgi:tetratricopeptide (TPR) repeat protein
VHNVRRRLDIADALYRMALALSPDEPAALANYASLLVVQGDLDAAEPHIARAWQLQAGHHDRISARPLVLKALVETLRGSDPSTYLGQLKALFAMGITHVPWPSGALSDALRDRMAPDDAAFYAALLNAIDDHRALEDLRRFERWERQTPVPLDHPWEVPEA